MGGGKLIQRKKRRNPRQSTLASRYLAAIECAQPQDAKDLTLSPLSRRSKSSHAKSTKTSRTAATDPTLDQTLESESWTEGSPNCSRTVEPRTPGREPLVDRPSITPTSQFSRNKHRRPEAVFPRTSPSTNVVVAAEEYSDGSSLTSRRTSESAHTPQAKLDDARLRDGESSSIESKDLMKKSSLRETQGAAVSLGRSIDQGLELVFSPAKWARCTTIGEEQEVVDPRWNPTKPKVSMTRTMSEASTEVVTNRAVDLAMRRIKEMEKGSELVIEEAERAQLRGMAKKRNQPIRYSFGVPHTNPKKLEATSILSVSSNDESTRIVSPANMPGARERHTSPTVDTGRTLGAGVPVALPVVPRPPQGRLGKHMLREERRGTGPVDCDISFQSQSISSSVGVEVGSKRVDKSTPALKAIFSSKTAAPASRKSSVGIARQSDRNEHLESPIAEESSEKESTAVPERDRQDLLMPSLSLETSSMLVPVNRRLDEFERRTFSMKNSLKCPSNSHDASSTDDECMSPPKIMRRATAVNKHSPDPVFCSQRSLASQSVDLSNRSDVNVSRFSRGALTSEMSPDDSLEISNISEVNSSLSLDGYMDARVSPQLSVDLSSRHSDGAVFMMSEIPIEPLEDPEPTIPSENTGDALDETLGVRTQKRRSRRWPQTGDHDRDNFESSALEADPGSARRENVVTQAKEANNEIEAIMASASKELHTGHNSSMNTADRRHILHLGTRPRSSHSGSRSDHSIQRPLSRNRRTPKAASAFLAAVSKSQGRSSEQPMSDDSENAAKTAFGKNRRPKQPVKGGLDSHLSRTDKLFSALDNDQRSVDVQSLRSAFESIQSSEHTEKDDDDTASVKSLRERYEEPTEQFESKRGISKVRAMFEAKNRPAQKPFETGNSTLKEAFSKFEAKRSRSTPIAARSRSSSTAAAKFGAAASRQDTVQSVDSGRDEMHFEDKHKEEEEQEDASCTPLSVADRIRVFGSSQRPCNAARQSRRSLSRGRALPVKMNESDEEYKNEYQEVSNEKEEASTPKTPSSFHDSYKLFSGKMKEEEKAKQIATSTFRERINQFSSPQPRPRSAGGDLPRRTPPADGVEDKLLSPVGSPKLKPVVVKPVAMKPRTTQPVRPVAIKPIVRTFKQMQRDPVHSATKSTSVESTAAASYPVGAKRRPGESVPGSSSTLRDRIAMFSKSEPVHVSRVHAMEEEHSADYGKESSTESKHIFEISFSDDSKSGEFDSNTETKADACEDNATDTEVQSEADDEPGPLPTIADRGTVVDSRAERVLLKNAVVGSQPLRSSDGLARGDESVGESESEFSDGVTLDLSIAEVSGITTPTALVSRAGDASAADEEQSSDPSSKSVDLIEAEAKRSEASSSQTSEAAAPLIAKAMRMRPMSDDMSMGDSFFAARALVAEQWSNTSGWDNGGQRTRSSITREKEEGRIEEERDENSHQDEDSGGWDLGRAEALFPVRESSSADIFDFDSEWVPFPSPGIQSMQTPFNSLNPAQQSQNATFLPLDHKVSEHMERQVHLSSGSITPTRTNTSRPAASDAEAFQPASGHSFNPAYQAPLSLTSFPSPTPAAPVPVPSVASRSFSGRSQTRHSNQGQPYHQNQYPPRVSPAETFQGSKHSAAAQLHRTTESPPPSARVFGRTHPHRSDPAWKRRAGLVPNHRPVETSPSVGNCTTIHATGRPPQPNQHRPVLSPGSYMTSHSTGRPPQSNQNRPAPSPGNYMTMHSAGRPPQSNQHRPVLSPNLKRYGAQHAALMARLKSLKDARMRRASAIYGQTPQTHTPSTDSYGPSNGSYQPEPDEYSSSTMSSTRFGGETFFASLEVD